MLKFMIVISILLAISEGSEGPDIVNGHDVKRTERPYQVSLQEFGYHFCGGVIISEYYLLTAAHCTVVFDSDSFPFLTAVVGMVNMSNPGQTRQIENKMEHENYDPDDSFRNDISLVKVRQPFTFDSMTQAVIMPKPHAPVPGGSAVVLSGWGDLGGGTDKTPTILQEVTIYVVDQQKCKEIIEPGSSQHVYKTNLCAYDSKTRKGQCTKDSGGPLTLDGTLVGIVSWSYKDPYCGSKKKPALFTRIPEYVDWIEQHKNL